MRTFQRYSILLLLLAGFWACEDFQEHNIAVPTGEVSFDSYIAVGNSLTAGFQSNALYAEAQQFAFPNLIANQAGIKSDFNQPLFSPGVANEGGQIVVTSFTNNPASPIVTGRKQLAGPNTIAQYIAAQPSANYNNLGVPGAILDDYLDFSTRNDPQSNPFYSMMFGPVANNMHDYVKSRNPTLVTFWLGNNDILGFATSGGLRPFTPATLFDTQYNASIDSILGINNNLKIVLANIPNVSDIAFTRTVGPALKQIAEANQIPAVAIEKRFTLPNGPNDPGAKGNTDFYEFIPTSDISNPDSALFLLTSQAILPALGGSVNEDSATYSQLSEQIILNTWKSYAKAVAATNQNLPTPEQIDQFSPNQLEDLLDQITIGRFEQKFGGAAAQAFAAAFPGYELDEEFGLHPRNPIPNQFVLDKDEINITNTVVERYNETIQQVRDNNSNRIGLVDVNSIFGDIVANGGVNVDGETLTPTILSLFSLDGVHPTNQGHAYIANQFIKLLNTKFGADLREIDMRTVPSGIPLPSGS